MAAVTIRNLPDETHRALKQRATAHGRSTEAEIRSILEAAVHPKERLKLGSAIVARVREIGGVDLDIERDRSPIEPPSFE
ncbi:FitA-like ribbon-helix-helix domain-containing protein [Rhizobium sp. LjRoot254]|uniref:FitA-like ribbon-helix-helix domain-containing protein n=1 Tax=Rhizobium sp. LjRoot254 TaxID=3342297 RepID=UPI003ECF1D10